MTKAVYPSPGSTPLTDIWGKPVEVKHEQIVHNAVRCLKCDSIIESLHRHDFVFCSCGNIAVDGGHEYLRRVGLGITQGTYEDLSTYA